MYLKGLLYTLIIRFNYRFGIFVARWGGGGRMQRQKREVAASGSCEREEEEEDW